MARKRINNINPLFMIRLLNIHDGLQQSKNKKANINPVASFFNTQVAVDEF